MAKKTKHTVSKKSITPQPVTVIPEKQTPTQKIIRGILIISAIVGIIIAIEPIKKLFQSPKEKDDDENIRVGIVNSPKISSYTKLEVQPQIIRNKKDYNLPIIDGIHVKDLLKREIINIQIGGNIIVCPTVNLIYGINIPSLHSGFSGEDLQLVAKDDRLYVSAKFIDFETENEIGIMRFNHWTLYKGTYLDYHPGDDKFEVIDKKGHIVFSMAFADDKTIPVVSIAGYFVCPKSVLVLNNEEYFSPGHHYINDHDNEWIERSDSNWKQKAIIEIGKIKSTFPTKPI